MLNRGNEAMTDTRFIKCSQCGALNEPRAVFCSRCGAALPSSPDSDKPRLSNSNMAMGAVLLLGLLTIAFVLYSTVARSIDKSVDVVPYADQKGVPASLSTTTTVQTDATGMPVTLGTDPSSVTTTTDAPILVRPKATVASSALKGTSTASFQATNLVDSSLLTAWIEGTKGPGLGEWVRFEFSQPTVLTRIDIANGYQKDANRFAANPRVRLVNVEFSSGATYLVELQDTMELQYMVPPKEAVEWVKMVIISIYPGKDNEETALSDVRLFEKVD